LNRPDGEKTPGRRKEQKKIGTGIFPFAEFRLLRVSLSEFQKRSARKKPFRRGWEGLFVFRDPSWSQGQNCWDELGIPLLLCQLRGGAGSSSNQFHRVSTLVATHPADAILTITSSWWSSSQSSSQSSS
jgi:hypothetical protein